MQVKSEHAIQNDIMVALSEQGCIAIRTNTGEVTTADGRRFRAGPPTGWPDITAIRRSDGRAVLVEVKTPTGKRRPEQVTIGNMLEKTGAIYGVCRSAEDAVALLKANKIE